MGQTVGANDVNATDSASAPQTALRTESMASERNVIMGLDDKTKHQAEEATGKAKEFVGDKTDNERLQAEGQAEQTDAKLKQAGDKARDAAHDAKDAFTG
jgi:uncharacterized protein YjbJ (UPF0337 family)